MSSELVHLRGECWLTVEDHAAALAQVAAAPPFTPNQREKLRTLLTPVDKQANDAAQRYAQPRPPRARGGGNQRAQRQT